MVLDLSRLSRYLFGWGAFVFFSMGTLNLIVNMDNLIFNGVHLPWSATEGFHRSATYGIGSMIAGIGLMILEIHIKTFPEPKEKGEEEESKEETF